jgi:hypothetical protein
MRLVVVVAVVLAGVMAAQETLDGGGGDIKKIKDFKLRAGEKPEKTESNGKRKMRPFWVSKHLSQDLDFYIQTGDYYRSVYIFEGKQPNAQLRAAAEEAAKHFEAEIAFVVSSFVDENDEDLGKEMKKKKDRVQAVEDWHARRKALMR